MWNKLTEWIRNHPFPVLIAGFVLVAVICLASCQGLVNVNDSDGASVYSPVASDTNVGSTVIGG